MSYISRNFPVYDENTISDCENEIKAKEQEIKICQTNIVNIQAIAEAADPGWAVRYKDPATRTIVEEQKFQEYVKYCNIVQGWETRKEAAQAAIKKNQRIIAEAKNHILIRRMPEPERLGKFWESINAQIENYRRDRPEHCYQRNISINRIKRIGSQIYHDPYKEPKTLISLLAGLLLDEMNATERNHNLYTSMFLSTQSDLAKHYLQAFKENLIVIDNDPNHFLSAYQRYREHYEQQPEEVLNPSTTFWSRNKGKILTGATFLLGGISAGVGAALIPLGVGVPFTLFGAALIFGGAGFTLGSLTSISILGYSVYKQNRPVISPDLDPRPPAPGMPKVAETSPQVQNVHPKILSSSYGPSSTQQDGSSSEPLVKGSMNCAT